MSERVVQSTANESVKRLRPLFTSARERRLAQLFVAEGLSLCREAAAGRYAVKELWHTEKYAAEADEICRQTGAQPTLMSREVCERLTDQKTPQGIFAVCSADGGPTPPEKIRRAVALFDISDPLNAGAILRSAGALGFDVAAVAGETADLLSPKALRGGMGTQLRLPVLSFESKPQAIEHFKSLGFACIAAALTESAAPLVSVDPGRLPVMLIFGNEGAGLDKDTIASCENVIIPMSRGADSLNAAVAAGIFMWHFSDKGETND